MNKIKIYHNPRWSKSRESVKILNENNLSFETIEYLKINLTYSDVKEISVFLDLKPKDFIRKKDKDFMNLNLSEDQENNDDFMIKLIVENPKFLERPIIAYKNQAIIGRPPEKLFKFLDIWEYKINHCYYIYNIYNAI